jgi:hypothetical protein
MSQGEKDRPSWLYESEDVKEESNIELGVTKGGDEKAWFEDEPPSHSKSQQLDNDSLNPSNDIRKHLLHDTRGSRSSDRKSSYVGGSVKEDGQPMQYDEDCCCCPNDPVLWWFALFQWITGLTAATALITNIYSLAAANGLVAVKYLSIRCFAVLLCALIVFIESEWDMVLQRLKVMHLWIFRGLFYAFVGLITSKYILFCFCRFS